MLVLRDCDIWISNQREQTDISHTAYHKASNSSQISEYAIHKTSKSWALTWHFFLFWELTNCIAEWVCSQTWPDVGCFVDEGILWSLKGIWKDLTLFLLSNYGISLELTAGWCVCLESCPASPSDWYTILFISKALLRWTSCSLFYRSLQES